MLSELCIKTVLFGVVRLTIIESGQLNFCNGYYHQIKENPMKQAMKLTAVSVFLLFMSLSASAWADVDFNLDHYQCYEVKDATKLDPVPVVSLEDQFDLREGVKVKKKPELYCTPVIKNTDGFSGTFLNEDNDLTCYRIDSSNENEEIELTNQFGDQSFTLKKSKLLCVPTRIFVPIG